MKTEAELRADWAEWNRKAHPEDQVTFMDYLGEIGVELEEEDDWDDDGDDDWFGDEDD
jgi:hypothetical protein